MNTRTQFRTGNRRPSGFTLMEVMITVAIIGILSAIAIPSYTDYVTRGKLSEAHSSLSDMRVRLEQYYQDNRTYVGAPACTATTGKHFTYSCPAATLTATAFVAQAAGVAAQGTGGFTFTIDQANARATTAVPSGWASNATCWVVKKGGVC